MPSNVALINDAECKTARVCNMCPQADCQRSEMFGQSSTNTDAHYSSNLWLSDDEFGNFSFICLWVGCHQQYKSLDQLEVHMDLHLLEYESAPLTEIVCQVQGCRILVSSVEELMRHMKMHIFHASRMLNGAFVVRERCPSLFSCNFAKSTRLVYQGDPLLCEWNFCSQSFVDLNEFIEHVELHVQLLTISNRDVFGSYVCLWNECEASFENRTHLLRHVQHHNGDKMCACPFCGAFFSNSAGLVKHVTRRQHNGDSSLVCRFCQKIFPNELLLRKHCIRHLKTHKCHFCSLLLTSPYDLNRHIQSVHAKMRSHRCEYCDRTKCLYTVPGQELISHFGFYQRSDLNKHFELHFNDSVHECQQCGKRFRWSKQLREHARQHKEGFNPTPYECHLCNSRYARGSALSKHFINVHQLPIPIGFSRFQYKKCQDGLFRLQIKCYLRGNLITAEEQKQS